MFLSASVVDHRATLLRWWEGGKEYQAWSNVDFKFLTGFGSFSKGDRHFVTFMGVGDVSSASLRKESMFSIPAEPPAGAPDFRMIKGTAGETEGYDAIVALHELYATDGKRLREAYELREARRKEAEGSFAPIHRFRKTSSLIFGRWSRRKKKPTRKRLAIARPR